MLNMDTKHKSKSSTRGTRRHHVGTQIQSKINRGGCLWCGNMDNIFQCSETPCSCQQYTPNGKYGSRCSCGHGEIWHHHNNEFREHLSQTPTINSKIGPYISSLKKRISEMEIQNKTLLTKVRNRSEINTDSYLCSVCLKNRRDTVFLPCRHAQFCETCSKKWLEKKQTCPICRKHVECILDIII